MVHRLLERDGDWVAIQCLATVLELLPTPDLYKETGNLLGCKSDTNNGLGFVAQT